MNSTSQRYRFSPLTPLTLGLLLLISGCAPSETPAANEFPVAENRPPNIVFILADDLGWTDLGCFGSTFYETPNLDRLATEGMRFTSAYTAGPNCAPTRASLMSGQYTPRHGVYTVSSGARGRAAFRQLQPVKNRTELTPSIVTLAEALRSAGYATAHFGKWHLGGPPHTSPEDQGFDVNVAGYRRGSPHSYFSPYRNPALADGPENEHLTDRLTREAIAFMETHRDRPFFVYLATYAVHTPLQAKPELVDKYRATDPVGGHSNPTYAGMIETLDTNVGRMMVALDQLGLRENTIVVFTSDNGGVGGYTGLRTRDITSNAPLRGGKGMLYEGGIRVPMIVRLPGVTDPGRVFGDPVHTVDFYPTLLEIARSSSSATGAVLDGISLMPCFVNRTEIRAERVLYWHFPGYLAANAEAGTWRTTPSGAIRRGRYKLIEFFEDGGRIELYDLVDDIGETRNLADERPDIARELLFMLRTWREQINAPMPRKKQNGE